MEVVPYWYLIHDEHEATNVVLKAISIVAHGLKSFGERQAIQVLYALSTGKQERVCIKNSIDT